MCKVRLNPVSELDWSGLKLNRLEPRGRLQRHLVYPLQIRTRTEGEQRLERLRHRVLHQRGLHINIPKVFQLLLD